ncbi:hypothetical protein GCM10011504_27360 [Siccirubricoccus deserti]|nr:hypothetical protein GCM10011504_27360 [Siccirubricoccus deserti]
MKLPVPAVFGTSLMACVPPPGGHGGGYRLAPIHVYAPSVRRYSPPPPPALAYATPHRRAGFTPRPSAHTPPSPASHRGHHHSGAQGERRDAHRDDPGWP